MSWLDFSRGSHIFPVSKLLCGLITISKNRRTTGTLLNLIFPKKLFDKGPAAARRNFKDQVFINSSGVVVFSLLTFKALGFNFKSFLPNDTC